MISHNNKGELIKISPEYTKTDPIISGTVLYGGGECYIESIGNVAIMEISYKGKIRIDPQLDSDYVFKKSKKRLLILNTSLTTRNGLWFNYEGEFKIVYCRVRDWFDKMVPYTVTNNHLGYWEDAKTNWNTGGKWSDYSGTY